MNVSQKVAALEALLEKVQRNAALPRPDREALARALPVNSPPAAETEAAAHARALPPSPTAPYPVIGAGHVAPPPPPPVAMSEMASPNAVAAAEPKEVALPSYTALHAIDMEPSSYPTLPGIAVPMQKSAAQAPAGPLPKVPPVVAPSPKPPAAAEPSKQAAAAVTTKVQAPAAATKAPDATAAKPAATAASKAPAVTAAKPEVTASPKPEAKPAAKSPVAPPVVAKPAARTPSLLAGKTLLGGVGPTLPKMPTTSSPTVPKAPTVTTSSAKAAPEPVATATKSPSVEAPLEPRAQAAPTAPVAPAAPPVATSKPAESDDVELPDDWGVEKPRELPSLVDETTGEFVVPAQASALFASQDAKAKPAAPVATASGLPKGVVDDESEESGDEPTVLRASPRDEIEKIVSSRAESSEEPTVLRKAPEEPPPSESEDSAEEPTMVRHSTTDALEPAKQAKEPTAEQPKRSEEPTNRNIRVALSPDLIAQAAAELEAKVERQERGPGSEEVTSLTKAPSETIAPPSEATAVGRPRRPPRTASIWGLFAASLVLIAGGVIVAKQKGWIPGGLPWDPRPVASTVSEVPTAPPLSTPSVQETAVVAPPTTAPSGAPMTDVADAGAIADASAIDAGDAGVSDAGDAGGAVDAGGVADAGGAGDAGGAVDAGAIATAPAPPTADGAPPKDPKSLPDKKGYLKVSTPGSLHVFVTGTHAGMTNEWLELDCGLKFLRIGDLPPGAAPAPGNVGVKWRSAGQPTAVPCKGQLEVPITPSP